jgi:hypothetical protein
VSFMAQSPQLYTIVGSHRLVTLRIVYNAESVSSYAMTQRVFSYVFEFEYGLLVFEKPAFLCDRHSTRRSLKKTHVPAIDIFCPTCLLLKL